MADALSGMPLTRACVVPGSGGWDEPTPLGPFLLLDVRPGQVTEQRRDPRDYGRKVCAEEALRGADALHTAAAMTRVLRGEEQGAHRDALVLSAALALEVAGRAHTPAAAAWVAAAAIDDGRGSNLMGRRAAFARGASWAGILWRCWPPAAGSAWLRRGSCTAMPKSGERQKARRRRRAWRFRCRALT
jgi:anthranilate phosphoribosyltransferase